MKKKFLLILLCLFSFNLFCKEKVVITVLDYQNSADPRSYYDNKAIWDAFEAAHPDIIIKREVLCDDAFFMKMDECINSGNIPDLIFVRPDARWADYQNNKLGKDLTPLLKEDRLTNSFNKLVINPEVFSEGYVSYIPFGLGASHCTFVNTRILKECGIKAPAKTYEELVEQSKILKEHGYECIAMANAETWVMQSCLFSMVVGRFGGRDWVYDIYSGKEDFTTSEPFIKAVEFIERMYEDGVLSRDTLYTEYSDVTLDFADENAAYMIDGDWRVGAFLTDASTGYALIDTYKQKKDIEIINFPAIPEEKYANSNSGYLVQGYSMSKSIQSGSAKEEAAWELMKWLAGPEMQQRRFDYGENFPSWVGPGLNFNRVEPLTVKRVKFYEKPSILTPVFDSWFSYDLATVLQDELYYLGQGYSTVEEVCEAVNDEWSYYY